jgi:hypothetical protein
MKRRWSIIVPVLGMLLYGVLAYTSVRQNRELRTRRVFYFGALPLERAVKKVSPPTPTGDEVVGWDPESIWIDPGLLHKLVIITGFPAYVATLIGMNALVAAGVSQMWSFFLIFSPSLIGWYYFVGWWMDRKRHRKLIMRKST